ncbi:MAG: threonine synthase [Coriobacteriia bacterium]|nr:threonine synthase [Coriobacteriia bacterium]
MNTPLTYHDTRDLTDATATFTDVVVKGIADGGGLFVPSEIPSLSSDEIIGLVKTPYWERAATVFEHFGVDLPSAHIATLMQAAYGSQWDDERIAPVIEVCPGFHVLELWHGPTSAFKDMALQCMPLTFSAAVDLAWQRGTLAEDYLILVATSGDTGKAALEGFADREHTKIVVFYPAGGVSDLQYKQMVTQRGENLAVFGVRGNFDDCQSAVKAAFSDEDFTRELAERHRLRLSSANSINWGRLLPQIAYYVSAYADMVASGGVKAGQCINACVPTGNFGNILAAYYAREMGVPIGRLVCASNENAVLADFIATGCYDISERGFVTTPSPSMDILVSSNLERLLYHLAGAGKVREWMAALASEKRFEVDPDTFDAIRSLFVGGSVNNDGSLATIRQVFAEDGYLLDPHTAVAWAVAKKTSGDAPMLIVSTAHWAKFGADVLKALTDVPYANALPAVYDGLTGVQLLEKVRELTGGRCAPIPAPLAGLDAAKIRFAEVVDTGRESVEDALRGWLET